MSTWNLPPGVTTNDLPGNRPEDRDGEQLEAEYIKQCGEKMARTIAETWGDEIVLHATRNAERRREVIVAYVAEALDKNLSELEIAETAAEFVGNPSFEEWLQEQS